MRMTESESVQEISAKGMPLAKLASYKGEVRQRFSIHRGKKNTFTSLDIPETSSHRILLLILPSCKYKPSEVSPRRAAIRCFSVMETNRLKPCLRN